MHVIMNLPELKQMLGRMKANIFAPPMRSRLWHAMALPSIALVVFGTTLTATAQPAGICTATVLNRSVAVGPGGSIAIPNVPWQPGLFRVRVTCVDGGTTTFGQSAYFFLNQFGPTTIPPIQYGNISPQPVSLAVTSTKSSLASKGETAQLTAVLSFPDGSTTNANTPEMGTLWSSSNTNIAMVTSNGLITAISRGNVMFSALNEGIMGSITINVVIPDDSDGDGIPDEWEIANGLNPNNPADAAQDTDGDSLTNAQEYQLGTNPRLVDTDGDGLTDSRELALGTNPLKADTDGDGLSDGQEVLRGFNPLVADSDGDGIADGLELKLGLNPMASNATTTVQGRVVETNGAPASGVTVVLFSILTTRTDNTGFFSLQNVPATQGDIIASAQVVRTGQIFDGESTATPPFSGGVTDVGSIALQLNSGNVVGTVLDPFNNPVQGALVTVNVGADTRTATTDTNGFYRVSHMTVGSVFVTTRDPATGLRGFASGNLLLNQSAIVNVTLGPWGTVAGTVFGRDGITPVSSGRNVQISGSIYIAALTDALGKYRYEFVPLGNYNVDAADTNANHGRTSGNISATSQVNVSDITYLGQGIVTGIVRDGAANPVSGATVTLNSQSVFGGGGSATSDGSGRYTISNVFVGPFTLLAQAPVTRLAGYASGIILQEGQRVTNNISVVAAGSITGVVFRADGVTRIPNAAISLSPIGFGATSDTNGNYRFDFIPLGSYTLNATDPSNGDRGRAGAIISAQDEVRTANILMNGLGTVAVTVRDGASNLVQNAQVTVNGTTQFGGSQSGVTGANGVAVFNNVFAGGFNVSATDPVSGLSGSTSGGVGVGATASVTVRLQTFGSIAGTVFQPDGSNAAPGITVRISGQVSRTTTTGADGRYQFNVVPTSVYTVGALDAGGNLRAEVGGVSVSSQGQVATQNLTMIGLGIVRGTVTVPTPSNNVPVAGLGITVTSQAPGFGKNFYAQSDINGQYSVSGVPVGPVLAVGSGQVGQTQYYGSTNTTVPSHNATVFADISVSSALVPSTTTLYDANNFGYEFRENGSIQDGSPGQMYGGDFSTNRAGYLLDLIVNGQTNRFAGSEFASLEENGRELAIRQNNLAGLNVTRKMYVPSGGYFVRYLESLNNPSGVPLTVTVKITSHFRYINKIQNGFLFSREPRLISTSSGDTVLDIANAVSRDHWLVVDDDDDGDPFLNSSTLPAVADLFEGTNATLLATSADFTLDVTNRFGRLVEQWADVTIPAGGTISFMHFATEQTGRDAARASVERLIQLPPEAIAGMTVQELAQVQNFSLPANGVSSLPALPTLTGKVGGRVLTGDLTNAIANAAVRFQSTNRLFGRTYTTTANSLGQFSFTGVLNNYGNSLAVPAGDFTLVGIHPLTAELSPTYTGQFPIGLLEATQDVVFPNSGVLTGIVRRHNNVVVSQGTVRVTGGNIIGSVTLGIGADGSFKLVGLPAGTYTLVATTPIAQGSDLTATVSAVINAAQTTSRVIVMPDTGIIAGTVRREGGATVVNIGVTLRGPDSLLRTTTTDTGGHYTFFDVPSAVAITLDVFDSFSNTAAHAQTNGVVDQTIVQDLTLISGGSVSGVVYSSLNNLAVAGAQVTLTAGNGVFTTAADANGLYKFFVVAPGNVSLEAFDTVSGLHGINAGNLALSGQNLALNIPLFISGSVTGVVLRADGVTPVPNAVVQLSGSTSRAGTADADGRYSFRFVPTGTFTVTGTDPLTSEYGTASGSIAANNDLRVTNVVLQPNILVEDATAVKEGNVGSTNAQFRVRLSSASATQISVSYGTASSSATQGVDFQNTTGTLIFPPGITNQSVPVPVFGDVATETDETFVLNLGSALNGHITDFTGVGTILNDDGIAGQIDHFVWGSVASPQFMNEPFPVTITALDAFNNVLSNYPGPVNLSAVSGTPDVDIGGGGTTWNWPLSTFYHDARCQTIYLASEIGSARSISGLALDVTSIPGQTMFSFSVRMKHTSLSSYGVNPVWESTGWTVVVQTNLTVASAGQLVLPFSAPFVFNGVDNVMVDISFNNNFYTGDGFVRATDTPLNRSLYFRTDSGYGDPLTWSGNSSPTPAVIARIPNIRLLGATTDLALSPTNSGSFVNGSWTGNLTVQQLASSVSLRANDGDGHQSSSGTFDVLVHDDISVSVSDAPDPVGVGANLVYTITVTNTGPGSATGVIVSNFLPASVGFVSATLSQGSFTADGGTIRCDLGTLTGATAATIAITAAPTTAGNVTNRVTVTRGEADALAANNSASTVTTVLSPFITIDDRSIVEGNTGTNAMVFNVRLSYPSASAITVNYASSNLTATAGSDYSATSGILTFAPGATNATIAVIVNGDIAIEPDETFAINLFTPTNGVLADAQGIGTIINDDGVPGQVASFQWAPITSPQFAGEPFPVALTALDAYNVVVSNYNGTANLSASAFGTFVNRGSGVAYVRANEPWSRNDNIDAMTLVFTNWQSLFYSSVNANSLFSSDNKFIFLEGSDGNANAMNSFIQANMSLMTNWVAGGGSLFLNAAPNVGGSFNMGFGVNLSYSDPTSVASAVNALHPIFVGPYLPMALSISGSSFGHATVSGTGLVSLMTNTVNGRIVLGEMNFGSGHVIFGGMTMPGFHSPSTQAFNLRRNILAYGGIVVQGSAQPIAVSPNISGNFVNGVWTGDLTVQGAFDVVTLRADDGDGHFGLSLPFATYYRNDLFVKMTASPSLLPLGATLTYSLAVTNTGPNASTAVVITNQLSTNVVYQGSALSQGTATLLSNNVVICNLGTIPGGGSALVSLYVSPIVPGTAINTANVSSAQLDPNPTNNTATAAATAVLPTLTISPASVREGDAGSTNALFLVTLSSPSPLTTTVGYFTSDNSTFSGIDYIPTNGVLTFAPGETNKYISVAVIGDIAYETDETFTVFIQSPVNATLANSSASGTILNDDPLPQLAINSVATFERNTGTSNMVFTVSLTPASGLYAFVNYATANGSATNGSDYGGISGSLSFAPGETNKILTVPILGDITPESDETFTLNLSGASSASITTAQGIGTILNDDGLPGQIDHFTWSAVPSPQYAGESFLASVTAKDFNEITVSNYNGPAPVSATIGTINTNVILGNIVPLGSGSLTYSLGFSFVPSTNILITHVRHISGVKVSIWTDAGALVASQPVVSTPGVWLETPLATPVQLQAGVKYRVTAYTGGGTYYYQTRPTTFPNGTIPEGCYTSGDGYPSSTDSGSVYLVDLKYQVGSGMSLPVTPNDLTGIFTNGVWAGAITVGAPGTNVSLSVRDGDGHSGTSNPFEVQVRNDLALTAVADSAQVDVRSNLTFTITVTNSGPDASTSVAVTDLLPPELYYVSSSVSQGSVSVAGQSFVANIGTLAAGASATVSLVTRPNSDVLITNVIGVTRSEPESYLVNNTAAITVRGLIPSVGGSFRIASLGTSGAAAIEVNTYTGDDRGGLVVSPNVVLLSGDSQTARFNAADLTAPAGIGSRWDSLISDLKSETIYVLGNGASVIGNGGGTVTTLLELNPSTGLLNGNSITLSTPVSISSSGNVGLFSGYGRVVLFTGSRAYAVAVPSGQVSDLGAVTIPSHQSSESWAYWGVAEYFDGADYLAYGRNSTSIARTKISDGAVSDIANFSNLSDLASFSVSVPRNRWYFHYESNGQFRNGDETLGYADAAFEIQPGAGIDNDLILTMSAASTAPVAIGGTMLYTLTVSNTGPATATGVIVTNKIPAGSFFDSITTSGATAETTNDLAIFNFGNVPSGVLMTVTVEVRLEAPGLATNSAVLVRDGQDAYLPNNRARAINVVTVPTVSIDNMFPSVLEGDTDTTNIQVSLSLSAPSPQHVYVNYFTFDDGSALDGSDYQGDVGTVDFEPGETNKFITVAVYGDTEMENDEEFGIYLESATNATLQAQYIYPTIINDDVASVAIFDSSLLEGNDGTNYMEFTVSLNAPSEQTLFVDFDSYGDTAGEGQDFIAAAGTLVFAAGETNKTILVPIIGDLLEENDETFFVEVFDPFTGNVASTATGTIINDDGGIALGRPGPLQITSLLNGTVTLEMNVPLARDAAVPADYVIEVSTDLQHWHVLSTNSVVNGKVTATDTTATDSAKFYRIRE